MNLLEVHMKKLKINVDQCSYDMPISCKLVFESYAYR